MAEWIFGPVEEREVHVILPVLSNMGGGIRNLIKLGQEWEFKFTVVHPDGAPMDKAISALPDFVRVENERGALEEGLEILTQAHKDGHETAFIHAYNPENTYEQGNEALSDFEIIGDAKNYQWLSTLNLCEGLIDSFQGYKSTDEILKEERLKKEFEEKQAAEEPSSPKAAAKKVTAPRKTAAKKVEPKETKALETEAEKPLQDVPEHNGPNPHRAPLPGNPIHDNAPTREDVVASGMKDPAQPLYEGPEPTEADEINRIVFLNKEAEARKVELSATVDVTPKPDIQEDIREAHAKVTKGQDPDQHPWSGVEKGFPNDKIHVIQVSKHDLAQLSTDIKELTAAFGNIMDTFTRILKDG
jgi:hypothetical protein